MINWLTVINSCKIIITCWQKKEKRQKKANRVSGLWVSTLGDSQITLDLREAQSGLGKAYINNIMMETVDILKVKWTGSKIEFHTTKIHVKWILPILERVKIRFSGHVSEDGEMMTGFLSSAENWQEVFIKNWDKLYIVIHAFLFYLIKNLYTHPYTHMNTPMLKNQIKNRSFIVIKIEA